MSWILLACFLGAHTNSSQLVPVAPIHGAMCLAQCLVPNRHPKKRAVAVSVTVTSCVGVPRRVSFDKQGPCPLATDLGTETCWVGLSEKRSAVGKKP